MAFSNPINSITVPNGAGPGQSREVLGQDIPAELIDFYRNSTNSPFILKVIAAQLFYNSANDYFYIAHLESVVGNIYPCLAIGVSIAGVIHPRMFFEGNITANPLNLLSDVVWEDPVTGNDSGGLWTQATLLASWVHSGPGLKYERVPSPKQSVWLYGRVTGGTVTNGTVITVLPVGFRPAHDIQIPVMNNGNATVVDGQVSTNGNVTIIGSGYTNDITYNCLVPLDY